MENLDKIEQQKNSMYKRLKTTFIVFFTISIFVTFKILWIQYSPDGEEYRSRINSNFDSLSLKAVRGSILSYDERILTATLPIHTLHMDFKVLHTDKERLLKTMSPAKVDTIKKNKDEYYTKNKDLLARGLHNFFKDKSVKEYEDIISNNYAKKSQYFEIAPRKVNDVELKELRKLPFFCLKSYDGGLIIETDNTRVFPYGNLARRLIGHINTDNKGAGIEYSLNSILTGTDGVINKKKVSGNFWVPITDPTNSDPVNGLDIVTTIDVEVQDVAEMMLRKQVKENNAEWGTAILMDVKSGEIRAMANYGLDENGNYGDIYNYGLGKSMEPGSTFKLISLMALLEHGKMNINTLVDCGSGKERVNGANIRDTRAWGYGIIPLSEVFQHSSNIGFARSIFNSYNNDPNRFINFIRDRNFDKPFNFEILGEGKPFIKRPYNVKDDKWSGHSLPMISFGYESLLTPLNILAIYNSVANNGVYVKPRIIKGYKKGNEYVYKSKIDTIYNGVCSKNNIRDIRYVLEQVVNDGTAKVLLNPYYKVAGKTGTSQVYVPKHGYEYNGGRNYLATVVGYFPAENPKYACIVSIELFHKYGSSSPYYGGSVSGPVFRAIADKVYSHAVEWGNTTQKPTKYIELNKNSSKLERGEKSDNENKSIKVLKTINQESIGSLVRDLKISNNDRTTIMYTDSTLLTEGNKIIKGTVPNVVGMGLRDAIFALNNAGYKFVSSGSGEVVEQIPEAGEIANCDSVKVKLILKNR